MNATPNRVKQARALSGDSEDTPWRAWGLS